MVEMCQVAGKRDQLITLLLPLAEHVLNVILIHFQDRYASFRKLYLNSLGFGLPNIYVHWFKLLIFNLGSFGIPLICGAYW